MDEGEIKLEGVGGREVKLKERRRDKTKGSGGREVILRSY